MITYFLNGKPPGTEKPDEGAQSDTDSQTELMADYRGGGVGSESVKVIKRTNNLNGDNKESACLKEQTSLVILSCPDKEEDQCQLKINSTKV